MFSSTG